MRKFFLITLIILFFVSNPLKASEWDEIGELDTLWDNQKVVTDKEFEQVMDKLNEKKKKKEQKKKKKLIKKISGGGTSLHKELNYDSEIPTIDGFKDKNEGILLNIPVDFVIDGKILEKGYYKLLPEKNKEKGALIHLYQSQFLKATIKVDETEDDFDKDTIDFAEVIPFNDSFVKLIFGSLDFNAYTYIQYIE